MMPERGHRHDVERGLPEQPGDAVVEAGWAPEEAVAVAEVDVGQQQARRHDRQDQQPHGAAHQHRPREQRRPAQAHARRPQRQDRGDHRGRGHGQGDDHGDQRGDVEADRVHVGAERAAVEGVGGEGDAARHQPGPVGGGAGPGEGEGRGADLERDHGGGQAQQQGEDAEEEAGRRVQRVHPHGGVGPEDLLARAVELLVADQGPDHARGQQEQQRRAHEQLADGARVAGAHHGGQPGRRSRRGRRGGGLDGLGAGSFGHGHERTLVRRLAVLGNLVTWLLGPRKTRQRTTSPIGCS